MSEVVPIRAGESAGTYACGDVCDRLADDATLFSARFQAAMLTPDEAWEAQP